MTNNWTDIGNASMVLVWGANPSENHPACMAHVNRARDNQNVIWPTTGLPSTLSAWAGTKGAKLVVVDPRKTRTAVQADKYIRHRPGSDIALINGVLRGIIAKMEDTADTSVTAGQRVQFFAFLNQTGNGTFYTDGFSGTAISVVDEEVPALKGTTASVVKRAKIAPGSLTVKNVGGTVTYTETSDYEVNYPVGEIKRTAGSTIPDGDKVWASYTTAPGSYAFGLVGGSSKYTDARFLLNTAGSDYDRETVYTGTVDQISNFPKKAATVDADPNTVYNRLKAHLDPYTPSVVSGITGVSESDIAFLVDAIINNSRCSTVGGALATPQDPRVAGYRATTILYAMGITQHTNGAQNIKDFANLQSTMGNMGRAGGGINALRGIHNVQGSTDAGLLYGNIPFYSGNPKVQTSVGEPNAFGKYMDALWGYPLSGSGTRATMDGSYADSFNTSAMGLQQRGFINMTYDFFGNPSWLTTPAADSTITKGLYDLWPKGNGDDHITMFRRMGSGDTKALVCWGQNPAVTEPNQSKIRDGLYNLDTLVVVDMFATETAMCSRKATGVTYLLPACSHVEEAGSVANSGRVLQWREKATAPKGKSKADLDLMLRFAYALDVAGAFTHITGQWTTLGKTWTSAYDEMYFKRYGWTPTALTNDFETANSGTANIWRGAETAPRVDGTVTGSEWIAELMFREICTAKTGISWLYTGAYEATRTTNKHTGQVNWQTDNRAKSRNTTDWNGTLAFPGWGYSWLVNRRVLYNNADIPGDVTDYYMGPDSAARLFVSTNTSTLNYSRWYRTIHRLADAPDVCLPFTGGLPTPTAKHILPGRFPGHTEPYETPREDLATTWGRNTMGTAQWDLIKADSLVAATGRSHDPANYPFILTTIRCVEHFQGGPITRNNPWNVEAEPEPWVEINSVDAIALGIADGDYVNVVTARGNSLGNLTHDTAFEVAGWSKGFKARVGAGTQGNQRVAPGVVAIPWHWGDQGLSKGSRANDLCIDSGDANTLIPESKACLCNLVKL